jgi:hypothetical protein
MALNIIGYRGRAGTAPARPAGPRLEERQVKRNYDVQMEALLFFTTAARAAKYEKNLPRLAHRVGRVEVRSGTVKRKKPAARPEERKAAKPAKKKAAKKKAAKPRKR